MTREEAAGIACKELPRDETLAGVVGAGLKRGEPAILVVRAGLPNISDGRSGALWIGVVGLDVGEGVVVHICELWRVTLSSSLT